MRVLWVSWVWQNIPWGNVCFSYWLWTSKHVVLAALGPQSGQSGVISGQTCGLTSTPCEFNSRPPDSPTAPPRKPLTSPQRPPIPDLFVLIKDVWVDALNPFRLSKTRQRAYLEREVCFVFMLREGLVLFQLGGGRGRGENNLFLPSLEW